MDRASLERAVAPLRHSAYRAMWSASLASNVGTWMHSVGAAWLMTRFSVTPLMIALVQTAAFLPTFLFGLFGGVLADTVDRRRVLIGTQCWMLAAACLMGLLTMAGWVTPWWLLALTFALGIGQALNGPAWQTTTPDMASREDLPAVIVLNGLQFNIARAIGPAIGGLIVAASGAGVVFLLNAVSFLGVIVVLVRWKPARPLRRSEVSSVREALGAGLRFVAQSSEYKVLLLRSSMFAFSFTALWALLPIVAGIVSGKDSASMYGLLLGAVGVGAILGAGVHATLRTQASADTQAMTGILLGAVSLGGLGLATNFGFAVVAALGCGASWIISMSVFNVRSQTAAPAEVRARSIAVFMLVFQGAMAMGSSFWGAVAGRWSVERALVAASIVTAAGLAAAFRLSLSSKVEEAPAVAR